jgi:hypothetical protein
MVSPYSPSSSGEDILDMFMCARDPIFRQRQDMQTTQTERGNFACVHVVCLPFISDAQSVEECWLRPHHPCTHVGDSVLARVTRWEGNTGPLTSGSPCS